MYDHLTRYFKLTAASGRLTIWVGWLYFLCLPLQLVSQAPGAAGGMSTSAAIKGKVRDASTQESIPQVLVYLYHSDSSAQPRYQHTDTEGAFIFEDLPFGQYLLKLSHVGYMETALKPVSVSRAEPQVNLGLIRMQAAAGTLAEVTITETRPALEFLGDTISLNLGRSMMGAGSSAIEALKTMPMVQVDINGRLSIAGKGNTRVFIDGKPSDFSAAAIADLLQVLPADAIEKIEVITNPDPKYSADGDGIINITMKKGYRIGMNGAVSVTAGSLGNYQLNSYAAYRTKTISLSGSYGYRDGSFESGSNMDRLYFRNKLLTSSMEQVSGSANSNNGHNLRASADWDIDSAHNLRLSASVNSSGSDVSTSQREVRLYTDITEKDTRLQDIINSQSVFNWLLDADYEWKLPRKNEILTGGLTWYRNQLDQGRYLERASAKGDQPAVMFSQANRNDIGNDRLEMSLNYRKPIQKKGTISAGVQVWRAANGNDQLVHGYDYTAQEDTLLERLSRPFRYTEAVYAGYISFNGRTRSKWNYRMGLREEFTRLRFTDSQLAARSPKPYSSLFPSFSLSKLFRKKLNLSFSYGRRITRPRENAINPLVDDINPSNISFGNPGLRPSYTDQFQVSMGFIARTWTLTPRLEWAQAGRIIERFRISPDSVTFLNLASSKRFTIGFYGTYRPSKKITLTAGANISQWNYRSGAVVVATRPAWSYQLNGSATGTMPNGFFAEAQMNYQNNAGSQGRSIGYLGMTAGIRKSLMKNKLQLRLLATDPFRQQESRVLTEARLSEVSHYSQQLVWHRETRNFSVSITYRFTKTGRNNFDRQKTDLRAEEMIQGRN